MPATPDRCRERGENAAVVDHSVIRRAPIHLAYLTPRERRGRLEGIGPTGAARHSRCPSDGALPPLVRENESRSQWPRLSPVRSQLGKSVFSAGRDLRDLRGLVLRCAGRPVDRVDHLRGSRRHLALRTRPAVFGLGLAERFADFPSPSAGRVAVVPAGSVSRSAGFVALGSVYLDPVGHDLVGLPCPSFL